MTAVQGDGMRWSVVCSREAPAEKDCVVLPVFKEELGKWEGGPFKSVKKPAQAAMATGDFEADRGDTHVSYPPRGAKRLVLLGLGKRGEAGAAELLDAYAALGKTVSSMGPRGCTFLMTEKVGSAAPHAVTLLCHPEHSEGSRSSNNEMLPLHSVQSDITSFSMTSARCHPGRSEESRFRRPRCACCASALHPRAS